jgi:hypothetical protein
MKRRDFLISMGASATALSFPFLSPPADLPPLLLEATRLSTGGILIRQIPAKHTSKTWPTSKGLSPLDEGCGGCTLTIIPRPWQCKYMQKA